LSDGYYRLDQYDEVSLKESTMAIESQLPSRQNPSPAQSQGDATSAPQTAPGHFEARETDTDVPNKEIAKPAISGTGQNGKPAPETEPAKPTPEAEPDPELDIADDDNKTDGKKTERKTDVGSGY
jgi:hypothetical protein